MRAPFPYYGGKSRVATEVWAALGDVASYIEPFAGSLAVLLERPHSPRIETINDKDGFLVNFWRATACDPDAVAAYANCPPFESDYNARLLVFRANKSDISARVEADPDWFDPRLAGWWLWGQASGILGNWPTNRGFYLGPPYGIHALSRRDSILSTIRALRDRLRHVRVLCGDWRQPLSIARLARMGPTGIFLDPPYSLVLRATGCYSIDGGVQGVHTWAIENGDNRNIRIALCGYEGEYIMPTTWRSYSWVASGGMDRGRRSGRGTANRKRERIWFSPHCIPSKNLFGKEKS